MAHPGLDPLPARAARPVVQIGCQGGRPKASQRESSAAAALSGPLLGSFPALASGFGLGQSL